MTEDVEELDDQGSRKPTRPWETALRLAEACRRQFEEPVTDLNGIEQRGIGALKKLRNRYSDFDTHLTSTHCTYYPDSALSASSMPINFLRPNEKPLMPADREKFADDLIARVYEAHLREASERMGNGTIKALKRKVDVNPEIDENYIHPEGLRRSSRLVKIARLA
jgi:hypothetical protein